MAHLSLNSVSHGLFIDQAGKLQSVNSDAEEVVMTSVCKVPVVSQTELNACPTLQCLENKDVAICCDGDSILSLVDLSVNRITASVSLSTVTGTSVNEHNAAYHGHVLVAACRVDPTTITVATRQDAFQSNGDSCRISCFRLSSREDLKQAGGGDVSVELVSQAVGPTAPLSVLLDSAQLVIVFADTMRPFQQVFPVLKPEFGPPRPPASVETIQQNPFDNSGAPAPAPAPLHPKPNALTLLDDAMEEDEDGDNGIYENTRAEGGTSFLYLPTVAAAAAAAVKSKQTVINIPTSSFLCSQPDSMSVCLKSSVDGIICSVSSSSSPRSATETGPPEITHVSTFDAFAYIFSSKRDKRFALVTRDGGYAFIVESSRYLYAYKKAKSLKAMGSDQWVIDLWEYKNSSCEGGGGGAPAAAAVVGDVRGVQDLGQGKVLVLCEDRVLVITFGG